MAVSRAEICYVIVLVSTALWAGATAQSSCTSAIVSLSPCLSYITGNSSTPSSSCCTQLSTIVNSQVRCLCTVVNGGVSSMGIPINQTQALTLPGACKVQTPPLSQCNATVAPASSPAQAPSDTPSSPISPSTPQAPSDTPSSPISPSTPSDASPAKPSTPSVPNTPSGAGSKTTPSTHSPSSAATPGMLPVPVLLLFLLLTTYASTVSAF